MENINFLYKSIDQYLSDINREYFLVNAGYNKRQDFDYILNKWKFIFNDRNILLLKKSESEVSIKTATYIEREQINLSVAGLEDEISNYFMNNQIIFKGKSMMFQEALKKITMLKNRQDRKDLYMEIWKNKEFIKKIKMNSIGIFFKELRAKYGSASLSDISGLSVNELKLIKKECEKFLLETNDLYNETLEEYSNDSLNIEKSELAPYDLSYIIDSIKKASKSSINLVDLINGSISGIGINNYTFRIDSYSRAKKSERAFCSPIWIPQSVFLVIKESNSTLDQKTALHEMGHALHYSNTINNLNPIDKRIGEGGLSEGYGFIFDLLFLDISFLKHVQNPTLNIKMLKWYQVYLIRKYIAKFFYEMEFIKNPLSEKNFNNYKKIMGDILSINETNFSDDDLSYIIDLEPWFYEIQYLKGWMFASVFQDFLVKKYTVKWWKSREAGKIMVDLWKIGQRPTINSIINDMGLTNLSFSYISRLLN
jgi:hypothetical protein